MNQSCSMVKRRSSGQIRWHWELRCRAMTKRLQWKSTESGKGKEKVKTKERMIKEKERAGKETAKARKVARITKVFGTTTMVDGAKAKVSLGIKTTTKGSLRIQINLENLSLRERIRLERTRMRVGSVARLATWRRSAGCGLSRKQTVHVVTTIVCSDSSRLSVNGISEVLETCSDDVSFHNQVDLCEPGGDDIPGSLRGSIDSGDWRLSMPSYDDECFQDSKIASIDGCVCSSTNSIEVISCSSMTSCCEYELCTLCKLDDYEHFSSVVSMDGGFSMYERVLPQRGAWSLIRRFDEASHFRLNCCDENASDEFALDVRAVRSCCDIMLDSGSDATVIPIGMISAGSPCIDQSSYLRDAQGSRIETEGVRDVPIVLSAVDGSEIVLKDKAHVSSRVDTPLISYGKLLRHGWGIVPEGGKSYLVHTSGARVELNFKQNSLLVSGVVRMISETVRVIDVDVPKAWRELKNGWYKTKDGFPLCSSHARHFVDVLKNHTIDEWPYRTTVGYRDDQGWQILELCQFVFQLDEREAPIDGGYKKLVTLLSKNIISLVDFGMVMNSPAVAVWFVCKCTCRA